MPEIFGVLPFALYLLLPILGFTLAARRPGHTRGQLLKGAVVGGGLAGALMAAFVALGGATLSDTIPFALIGLWWGVFIGAAGIAAFAVGKWLGRQP